MRSFYIILLFVTVLFTPAQSFAGKFKLYLDDTRTEHLLVEKQDCSVHKTKDGKITLGFKAGNFLMSVGPEVTFGRKVGIDWHRTAQGLIARYQELCSRFNTGSLSKAEYEKRLKEIEKIDKDALNLYQNFLVERERQKKDLFNELDAEASNFSKMSSIKKDHNQINYKLEELKISN
jgi:chaperonin cofactor prefoldin